MDARNDSPVTQSQLDETLSRAFSRFYGEMIEPEFRSLRTEMRLIREDIADIRGQTDDLYKKFEDLNAEYLVIKEQLKRIEGKLDTLGMSDRKDELPKLKQEVALLGKRVEDLERERSAKS